MKEYSKTFGIMTMIYLGMLLIATLFTLFSTPANYSVIVTSLLGIQIKNTITTHNITTTFSPTWILVISYFVTLILGFAINKGIEKVKNKQ